MKKIRHSQKCTCAKCMKDWIDTFHGKKVNPNIPKAVKNRLDNLDMHIDRHSILRYKNGMHPNSRKNLKAGAEGFKPGNSGFEGRRHITSRYLRAAFQTLLLDLEDSIDGRSKKETVALMLARMHVEMLKKAFRRQNLNVFSRLLADLRIFSG